MDMARIWLKSIDADFDVIYKTWLSKFICDLNLMWRKKVKKIKPGLSLLTGLFIYLFFYVYLCRIMEIH